MWAYPVLVDGSVDSAARRDVFGFDQPYEALNGVDLAFGPDVHLYVFSGDGGFVADPQRRALDLVGRAPKSVARQLRPAHRRSVDRRVGDFCSGVVRALEVLPDRTAGRVVDLGVVPTPVSVRAGPAGELFVVSIEGPIHPLVAG